MIEQLTLLEPAAGRTARTRARCHRKLARRVRLRAPKRFLTERAVFLGFGVIYLSSLAFDMVRVFIS